MTPCPPGAPECPERLGVTIDSVRTCLGCRQQASTPFLLRVVALDGVVTADPSARRPGRGAWIHPRPDCLGTALTRKAFGRALRKPDVAVDADALRDAIARTPTRRPVRRSGRTTLSETKP